MAAREGMVEKRGAGLWLSHAGLIVGVLFIFFPIWLAFVASTVTQAEITRPPMPLLPGDQFVENYSRALVSGVNAPVARMLLNLGWRSASRWARSPSRCSRPSPSSISASRGGSCSSG